MTMAPPTINGWPDIPINIIPSNLIVWIVFFVNWFKHITQMITLTSQQSIQASLDTGFRNDTIVSS